MFLWCCVVHVSAGDKQLYSATTIADIDATRDRLASCILNVRD